MPASASLPFGLLRRRVCRFNQGDQASSASKGFHHLQGQQAHFTESIQSRVIGDPSADRYSDGALNAQLDLFSGLADGNVVRAEQNYIR